MNPIHSIGRRLRTWTIGALCALLPGIGLADGTKPFDQPATGNGTGRKSVILKIDRPEKVGSKAEISVKSTNREVVETTSPGAPPVEQKTYEAGSLRAVREVLAVGRGGRATKLGLAIQSLKFATSENAEPKELFQGGKEVIAELKDGETTFTMDGKPVAADLGRALRFFALVEDEPDSEVFFNTKVPHAVGDEWDADLRELVKQDSFQDFTFDLKASTGKVRLERVEKVNGVECYIVTCKMTLIPTGMVGQDGAEVTDSAMRFMTTIPVPVDPAAPELGCKTEDEAVFKIQFKTADGTNPRVNSTSKTLWEQEIRGRVPAGK